MTVTRAQSFPTTLDVVADAQGYLQDVRFDDNGEFGEILLDICLYKFKKEIFKTDPVQLHNKQEWGLPHTFFKFITDTGTKVKVLETDKWIKVNSPQDLTEAERLLGTF
ncbi:MAG TPA: hypothetical protein PLF31_03410 [Candidatus Paceibacterota bacterium]|nr:hypothetical protein [Candidatus Paceibacterota bacterium]